MSQKYRMRSLAGPFRPGDVITEEQAKAAGGDLQFWKSHNAVEEVSDDTPLTDEPVKNNEAVNSEIEVRLRAETVKLNRPLTQEEQDKVVGEIKDANAKRVEARDEALANPKVSKPAPPPAPSKPAKPHNP